MPKIVSLESALAKSYRYEIAQLYFGNIQMCSHLDHYTFGDAYEKVGQFIDHLEADTCVGFAAFDGDELCGFVWAYPHQFRGEQRMYVSEIRVREDYRGKGIGRLGIGALYLHAEADNPDAIKFYESLGFQAERVQLRKDVEP